MQIHPVDQSAGLYSISEVFDKQLLEELHKKDLYSYEWEKENMQSNLLRRKLLYADDDILAELDKSINSKENLQQLSDLFHKQIWGIGSNFWLDEPGYTIGNHPDNPAVSEVIQVYLWPNTVDLGTTFYKNTAGKDELDEHGSFTNPSKENIYNLKILKQFPYLVNTGYVMKNVYQIHGMTVPVPAETLRFSLYGHIG
tara:strand:- start:41 stop:634 length:594 start_codon:yes stop_codon:yes gene_type:complete